MRACIGIEKGICRSTCYQNIQYDGSHSSGTTIGQSLPDSRHAMPTPMSFHPALFGERIGLFPKQKCFKERIEDQKV